MKPYYTDSAVTIYNGDCREVMAQLPEQSVNCCVTSPPYWGLRDYGHDGQLGLEATPEEYVANMVDVFREVKRVLRDDGTLWLNLGDSYSGSGKGPGGNLSKDHHQQTMQHTATSGVVPDGLKPKDLVGIPWRVAFALQQDGWYLRQDIIWHKPNPMPESVQDRCTKAHEYIFLMSKSHKYWYDADAIKEQGTEPPQVRKASRMGKKAIEHLKSASPKMDRVLDGTRNKRSVWTVGTKPYKGAHFAVFPPDLIKPCILAGCPKGGTVLDPFGGSGTTAEVAKDRGRKAVSIELNADYLPLQEKRVAQEVLAL